MHLSFNFGARTIIKSLHFSLAARMETWVKTKAEPVTHERLNTSQFDNRFTHANQVWTWVGIMCYPCRFVYNLASFAMCDA